MGAKDSKPCCITYEDAVKRVGDLELKRLRDAFKRASTLNGCMTKQSFLKEVLAEGVPPTLAEYIFMACGGGQKGITFKDLICGLVLLTSGKSEEKIKFIFGLYANESGTHVVKEEMTKVVMDCENQVSEQVKKLFRDRPRVTYEEFHDWLLENKEATSITKWLMSACTVSLSNDLETPTFYQTLAGVTHLEETDIMELEKRYWLLKGLSHTGKLDLDTLSLLVCPPVPHSLCRGLFGAFDENCDSHIDFKEMACGISAACRGPVTERQKFCFKVFDLDRDGLLSEEEVADMVDALVSVHRDSKTSEELAQDPVANLSKKSVVDEIMKTSTSNKGGLTLDEYLVWTVGNPLPMGFLNLLFQVCHIVLGLRPVCREEEGDIVRSWLERDERRGFYDGQVWYLVSMDWWKNWHEYINYQACSDTSSGSPSGSQCGSLKRGRLQKKNSQSLEGSLAQDTASGGVVVTGINLLPCSDTFPVDLASRVVPSSFQRLASPKRGSSTSLTMLATALDGSNGGSGSRPSSVTSSPTNSPRQVRRAGGLLNNPMFGPPPRPGAIDNLGLVAPSPYKVMSLTGEGGKLKKTAVLTRGRDFELVPEALWRALHQWYGGSPSLPRQVISTIHSGGVELELYPAVLRILRHQTQQNRMTQSPWAGVVGGYGAAALSSTGYAYVPNLSTMPRRYLAYTAAFSRTYTVKQVYEYLCMKLRLRPEDTRLWLFRDEANMSLLEEEELTLEEVGVQDDEQVLVEVRNKDQTWPEEIGSLSSMDKRRQSMGLLPAEKGATGLNNLGNTCFMNAALQCVSNTRALTQYFTNNMHLFELNRVNPLGMKGHIAKRYGDLIHDIWSGTAKTVAPLKLRWTIGKYAPRFNGFQQHDSQELLAFLLDGLHEDLNRVHDKPYVELKDSGGRPDVLVAQEAWENHILRNKSIIVDLFHGQLKSKVTCKVCGHESVRFDPFNYLSLPLPMESFVLVEVIVVRLDGSVPVRYGLQLNMEEKYSTVKSQLSKLTGISPRRYMLAEINGAQVKSVPPDDQKIKSLIHRPLYAYELPLLPEPGSDEDKSSTKSQREPQTFTQIQRATRLKANGSTVPVGMCPPPNPVNGSTHSSLDSAVSSGTTGSSAASLPHNQHQSSSPSSAATNSSSSSAGDSPPERRAEPEDRTMLLSGNNGNGNPIPLNPMGLTSTNSSTSLASYSFSSSGSDIGDCTQGFIVAFHRKMIRQDVYFLSSQKTRPVLFGLPLVVPCGEFSTQQDLYQSVWTQVARLVSPLPPSESPVLNHAQDCDDSLGYEYPFVLKAVQRDGLQCALCPWYQFCRGCPLQCNDVDFNFQCNYLAVDWDPTALHLRYQTSQELECLDHESVEESRRRQSEPINLAYCLEAFTKEEHLGEDEKYYCSNCKQHQLASKKLQIWRLPPILIVHLKRFQFVHGKWIKSQKVVNFPFRNFDPTDYLASVPRLTAVRYWELENAKTQSPSANHKVMERIADEDGGVTSGDLGEGNLMPNGGCGWMRGRLESTSLLTHPINDRCLQDFHQHRLREGWEPFQLNYHLYSVVCHSGILGGGHYISYACNPNRKWYCYNDSSCKEVQDSQIDTSSAYMLFYEREGLNLEQYMPNVEGKTPDLRDLDDELESDLKRLCCLM